MALWRIAVDAPEYTAEELAGKGAELTGGRWNRKGRPVLYTSSSISLACLETVVHMKAGRLPLNRYLVRIDVPENVWAAKESMGAASMPTGWHALPEGKVSLDFGDAWIASVRSPLLRVPSVIVPEEMNVLINPAHPLNRAVVAKKLRRWSYDARLVGVSLA